VADDGTGEDGFVRRWSRLKRVTEEKEPGLDAELEVATLDEGGELVAGESVAPEDASADAPEDAPAAVKEIAAEDLPDIDSLEADSDFTPFMQEGVPEKLQRLALRKLWNSDPILANVDGLNDYDEDFKLAMEIGTAFMDKARAAGVKFIGEHPDEPPEDETPDEETPGEETPGEETPDAPDMAAADAPEDSEGDEVTDEGEEELIEEA